MSDEDATILYFSGPGTSSGDIVIELKGGQPLSIVFEDIYILW